MTPNIAIREKKLEQIIFTIPNDIYTNKRKLEKYLITYFDDMVLLLEEQSGDIWLNGHLKKFENVIIQITTKNGINFLQFEIVPTFSSSRAVKEIIRRLLPKKSPKMELFLKIH